MKRRIFALSIVLVLILAAFAIAETVSCPRMGASGCAMMADGSCAMMTNGSCPMMADGSCSMMADGSCPMNSGSCSMSSETCSMNNGSCAMGGCASASGLLPCCVVGHEFYNGIHLPAYHYLLCEDCTQVTGADIYMCFRSCPVCGLHVHLQESEHDCPIVGPITF